ncbi:ATP-binding protein [Streptomyces sp. NPDC050263]|uniref:ATP-binding protein n=1 Tax=Streptomyces sp. NPDC050263 TaxID=3155037 RepID=UPI0034224550
MPTVTPPWSYTLQLPHDLRAPGIARVTLRTVLAAHDLAQLTPTAELLAAELLANAHLHTVGPYALRLRSVEHGRLRVGVWDSDPRVPGVVRPAAADDEHGRGLQLVEACAARWGASALGGTAGKVVWAECG